MIRRILPIAGVTLLSGCLPFIGKGKPKSPPPVATVETTRIRADSLWVAGQRHFRRGKWSKASRAFDQLLLIMDYGDPRRARAHFFLAEVQLAQDNNLQAVREFRRVADENSSDSLAPDALLRAGDAYADLWRRPELDPSYGETALLTYREVTERYPGSSAARRAGNRATHLQERFAEKEFKTASFYLRYKAYDSAILSLRNLIANYPRTRVVPDALVKLVEAYHTLKYEEDLRETCRYVDRFFPNTMPRLERTCPAAVADST